MSSHMAGGYKCAVHCFFLEMFAARVSGSTTTRLDNSGTICFAGGGGGGDDLSQHTVPHCSCFVLTTAMYRGRPTNVTASHATHSNKK